MGLHVTRTICNAVTALCFGAGVVAILVGAYSDAESDLKLVGVGLWVVALIARIAVFAISRSRSGHAE
ncbi:hypothetical protein GPX89_14840 [Nocardia sp. ET3-3]|uniref:Uncharacterized protein n=1 Tax=Nocardia terrae TaxID=2675851 RepID=A0A7K1UX98_9NOCA|nr:hypothetical protein [Nocardia terrae]MVU78518.1 hypothetical protein [Nocardia terrae]